MHIYNSSGPTYWRIVISNPKIASIIVHIWITKLYDVTHARSQYAHTHKQTHKQTFTQTRRKAKDLSRGGVNVNCYVWWRSNCYVLWRSNCYYTAIIRQVEIFHIDLLERSDISVIRSQSARKRNDSYSVEYFQIPFIHGLQKGI